jgi:hypothetical protein
MERPVMCAMPMISAKNRSERHSIGSKPIRHKRTAMADCYLLLIEKGGGAGSGIGPESDTD